MISTRLKNAVFCLALAWSLVPLGATGASAAVILSDDWERDDSPLNEPDGIWRYESGRTFETHGLAIGPSGKLITELDTRNLEAGSAFVNFAYHRAGGSAGGGDRLQMFFDGVMIGDIDFGNDTGWTVTDLALPSGVLADFSMGINSDSSADWAYFDAFTFNGIVMAAEDPPGEPCEGTPEECADAVPEPNSAGLLSAGLGLLIAGLGLPKVANRRRKVQAVPVIPIILPSA